CSYPILIHLLLSLFRPSIFVFFFFFNHTATTEIYTLSLHDALPISHRHVDGRGVRRPSVNEPLLGDIDDAVRLDGHRDATHSHRSEEHTSELQSRVDLVCRLLLEKKKKKKMYFKC